MTSHKDYRLDQLGITSQYEADELERDLNVRFDLFAYNDREVWVQQNAYLHAYARNHAVSDSADVAGVPVSIAQNWEYHNTLGFKRRLEIADLRFSDSLQVLALERVREPNAPAVLLIELLRAHIPEKFSSNGHVCDTSKADEQLFFYSQDAQRELEAGHPGLSAIAEGTYQPSHRSRSHDDPSPLLPPPSSPNPPTPSPVLGEGWGEGDTPNRHTGEGRYPEAARPNSIESDHETPFPLPDDDIEPIDPDEVAFFNLSPEERNNTPNPSASSAPSAPKFSYPLSRSGRGSWGEGDTPTRHSREHGNPQTARPHSIESDHETPFPLPDDDIEPVDPDEVAYFNLSPEERENTPNPSAPSAANPPAPKPPARLIASLFQKARPNPNDDHDTFPVKRF